MCVFIIIQISNFLPLFKKILTISSSVVYFIENVKIIHYEIMSVCAKYISVKFTHIQIQSHVFCSEVTRNDNDYKALN